MGIYVWSGYTEDVSHDVGFSGRGIFTGAIFVPAFGVRHGGRERAFFVDSFLEVLLGEGIAGGLIPRIGVGLGGA